ncbi:MAG: hypothetical protein K6A98_07550 [Prevotella sp.]|nr:hypothetical protein [Prevotella sp.]
MKNKVILLIVALAMSMATFAQKEYTYQQKQLRDRIFSYIKGEGYRPEIDDDGDIMFKKEGDTYFVIVSADNSAPMYLSLTKIFTYSGSFTKNKIKQCMQEINLYKMCKLVPLDESFEIRVEMFLNDAGSFTSIFEKALSVINQAEEELKDM